MPDVRAWSKGPWGIDTDSAYGDVLAIGPNKGQGEGGVCYGRHGIEVSDRDARLIALAPDMADAILACADEPCYDADLRTLWALAEKLMELGSCDA